MSERQRLDQKLSDAHKRWERLSERLSRLQKQVDLETREDEKLRLEPQITDAEKERQSVEDELYSLEARQNELRRSELVQDARRMERKRSFTEALRKWEEIRALDPDVPGVAAEIDRLTEKQKLAHRLKEASRRLTRHMVEIKDVFVDVSRRLTELGSTANELEATPYLSLVEGFLGGELSPDELRTMWLQLDSGPGPLVSEAPDYPALADRLERGELVVFLGSDVPSLFDARIHDSQDLAEELARRVHYDDFAGSLSMISEYYEISEHGKPSLVRNLESLLPAAPLEVPLYSMLARTKTPLVVLSTSYDTLLERTFKGAGKRFAVISTIVSRSAGYEVGSLLVNYSDREGHDVLRLEQGLSELDLHDQGYSLLYKVRGCVDAGSDQDPERLDALTLAEESYFTFAASKHKLIPNYVVEQFRGRGFLLLGCIPRQWEDRLILTAVLEKRRHAETPMTVRNEIDRFENAYWVRRNVRRYPIDLKQFVESLEVHLD